MDANMIVSFFKAYGWQLTVLATSGILVLGLLKSTGIFNKLKASVKKYVYYAVSCAISIIACTAYIFILKQFSWLNWGVLIVAIIAYTGAIYTLYENTGIRTFLKKFVFTPLKNAFHKLVEKLVKGSLSTEDVKALALAMGADVLQNLTIEAQKAEQAKLEAQQAQAQEQEAKEGAVVAVEVEPQNTVNVVNVHAGANTSVTEIK